jgi:hypothetical protein
MQMGILCGQWPAEKLDKDFEIEHAKQFTAMIERIKGKVVAPQHKRLQ